MCRIMGSKGGLIEIIDVVSVDEVEDKVDKYQDEFGPRWQIWSEGD